MCHRTAPPETALRQALENSRRIRAGRAATRFAKKVPDDAAHSQIPTGWDALTRRKDLYADGAGGTHAVYIGSL